MHVYTHLYCLYIMYIFSFKIIYYYPHISNAMCIHITLCYQKGPIHRGGQFAHLHVLDSSGDIVKTGLHVK